MFNLFFLCTHGSDSSVEESLFGYIWSEEKEGLNFLWKMSDIIKNKNN